MGSRGATNAGGDPREEAMAPRGMTPATPNKVMSGSAIPSSHPTQGWPPGTAPSGGLSEGGH